MSKLGEDAMNTKTKWTLLGTFLGVAPLREEEAVTDPAGIEEPDPATPPSFP
jgi:hypothetical protein